MRVRYHVLTKYMSIEWAVPGNILATTYMKIRLGPSSQEAYSPIEDFNILSIRISGSKCKATGKPSILH